MSRNAAYAMVPSAALHYRLPVHLAAWSIRNTCCFTYALFQCADAVTLLRSGAMTRALILIVAMCACTRARVDEPAKRARHDTLETAEPLALVPGEQHEHLETWRIEVTRPMAMLPAWFVIEVPHPSAAATDVHAQAYTLGPDGDHLSIDALDEHRAPMDLVGRTPARRVFLHVTPRKIRRTAGREFRLEISSGYIAALERLPHANDPPETPCNANQPDFKNLACCSCGNCTASVVRFEHGLVTLGQG